MSLTLEFHYQSLTAMEWKYHPLTETCSEYLGAMIESTTSTKTYFEFFECWHCSLPGQQTCSLEGCGPHLQKW